MQGAVGYGDQVVLHALDFIDLAANVQREQSRTGDEKAYFVFLVVVLVQEFRPHDRALGMVRGNADHIHALEATLSHQTVNVTAIGRHDFFG